MDEKEEKEAPEEVECNFRRMLQELIDGGLPFNEAAREMGIDEFG